MAAASAHLQLYLSGESGNTERSLLHAAPGGCGAMIEKGRKVTRIACGFALEALLGYKSKFVRIMTVAPNSTTIPR
jgi:hypothetical protein